MRARSGSWAYLRLGLCSNLYEASAYTLVELFLTLAVLMVILGMMINLSNRVRKESADKATRLMLSRLTTLMAQYRRDNNGQLPPVTPLIDSSSVISESTLLASAKQNNLDFSRCLKLDELARHAASADDPLIGAQHQSATDTPLLQDPWGSPIVFMPSQHPAIGMAPGDTFFFFSAGPDRLYLTQQDNFYSYEEMAMVRNAEP